MENAGFGAALEALEQGKKVKRKEWIGSYIWLLPENKIPKEWIKDEKLLEVVGERTHLKMGGMFRIKGADGIVFVWNPTHDDLLANDWVILE